ncbi:MAG: hypothetical protein IJW40_09655 [Clostridia bacterium]|nr:hypothetical protein [Clostridia bacterium]
MTYLHILKGEMKKLTGNRVFLLLLLFLALLCAYVAFRQPAGGTGARLSLSLPFCEEKFV